MTTPTPTAADRALIERHVRSTAEVLDRALAALKDHDAIAWQSVQQQLQGGGYMTVRCTAAPSGLLALAVDLQCANGELMNLMEMDLTSTQRPAPGSPLQ